MYALANLGILLPGGFANYLTFYYTEQLRADPFVIGSLLTAFAVWNAINNPIVGYLSDRTRSRLGRRLPWIFYGVPPAFTLSIALWNPHWLGIRDAATLAIFLLVLQCIIDVFATGIGQGYFSLLPEMFPKYEERTDIAVKMNLFQVVSLFIGLALPPWLAGQIGYGNVAVLFYAISAIFIYVGLRPLVGRAETPAAPALPFFAAWRATIVNRSFLTVEVARLMRVVALAIVQTGMQFYLIHSLKVDGANATLLLGLAFVVMGATLYPWRVWIARWAGARLTYAIAFVILIIGLSGLYLITDFTAAIVFSVVIGLALGGIVLMNEVILADVIDEDEARTGRRREGMYFGLDSFVGTLGSAVSAFAFALTTRAYGYDPALAAQPASVDAGFRLYIALIPIGCVVIGLVALWLYPLSAQRMATIRAQTLEK
jgi:GPH family glycoside/pentoside/hexuronide:cation symporter